ncbi:hypothetical protein Dimus_008680, partial [Dionaea muscipula]
GQPKSYKEAINGERKFVEQGESIRVQKAANGWLHKSAVATLHNYNHLEDCLGLIEVNGTPDILVRPCGGKQVIMTFPTADLRDKMLADEEEELRAWFKDIHAWTPSIKIGRNREVWLSCFGVPLELWSTSTFCEIASKWGEVLAVEIETAKSLSFYCGKVRILTECLDYINCSIKISCDGKLFPIRVIEEQVVLVNKIVDSECSSNLSSNESFGVAIRLRPTEQASLQQTSQNKASRIRRGVKSIGSILNSQKEKELRKVSTSFHGGRPDGLEEGEESHAEKNDDDRAASESGVEGERVRGLVRINEVHVSDQVERVSNPLVIGEVGEMAVTGINANDKNKEYADNRGAEGYMVNRDGDSTGNSNWEGSQEEQGCTKTPSQVGDSGFDDVAGIEVLFNGHVQQNVREPGEIENKDDLIGKENALPDLNLSNSEAESVRPNTDLGQVGLEGQDIYPNGFSNFISSDIIASPRDPAQLPTLLHCRNSQVSTQDGIQTR